MENSDPKSEYKDASDNIRHFQTVRFAQLTIFIAINVGLITALYGKPTPPPLVTCIILKSAGIVVSVLYWILQERTMLYWYHFMHRAVQLEEELGFKQYSTRPPAGWITGSNAVRLIYFAIILFWLLGLIWLT
ncbi:membrane hypothetical protein [Candidatus Zixiibacteriota bacterium]|nr:membrane hypothetical protein [candidate division Zixibacteria bacterium]